MRVEAERESGVEDGRHQISRALSARFRNLDVNLRAMGSHGRILSSIVCGQMCGLGRPITAV